MRFNFPVVFFPYVLLLFFCVFFAYSTYDIVSKFQALPSPIFGGDMYYQLGSVINILEGGNPFESSSLSGGRMPGYLPLFSIVVALFAIITGMDAFHALVYFSVILAFIIPLIWFFLIKKFVDNNNLALLCVLFFFLAVENPLAFPIIKYTNFTYLVVFPLFLFFLYETYNNFNLKNTTAFAFFYSILSISHLVVFISASFILGFFVVYKLYFLTIKKEDLKSVVIQNRIPLLAFLFISIPIILLYFYQPIFFYHLKPAYDRVHMDIPDFGLIDVQIWFIFDTIQLYFLNFSNISSFFFIFAAVSLILNLKKWQEDKKSTFIYIALVGVLSAMLSYFITEPLLHINFINNYIRSIAFIPVLFLCGTFFLEKQKTFINLQKNSFVFFVTFVILFYLIVQNGTAGRENNVFFKNAYYPIPQSFTSAATYVKHNTSVNDIFLSQKELGFILNALTGRKLVTNRWAHQNDPYADTPQRDLEAAIILYGNNDEERLTLLKKYNITYLYWDINWVFLDFGLAPDKSTIYPFDPLLTFDTPSNRAYLDKNNIKYINTTTWIDPSVKVWYVRQYPLLIVSYENYRSIERPWHPGLDKYLEEVWSYKENEQKIAAIYKIKYS
ncbi:MAG: hypothetical protein QXF35_01560 [Candidatus Bilamarchaeaceae archaeon]